MFLLKYLNENERTTIEEFMDKAKIRKKEAEQILVNFALINLIKLEITEKELYFTLYDEKND